MYNALQSDSGERAKKKTRRRAERLQRQHHEKDEGRKKEALERAIEARRKERIRRNKQNESTFSSSVERSTRKTAEYNVHRTHLSSFALHRARPTEAFAVCASCFFFVVLVVARAPRINRSTNSVAIPPALLVLASGKKTNVSSALPHRFSSSALFFLFFSFGSAFVRLRHVLSRRRSRSPLAANKITC